jgi:signal transduction histidine kinase
MGLWTVKHILDRHHATIAVQSAQGAGTTFTIHWPIHFVAHRRGVLTARA